MAKAIEVRPEIGLDAAWGLHHCNTMLRTIARPAIHAANWLLAKKPQFAIVGTPRSGTTYFSQLCRANGIICSHEAYFTEYGPKLRNPMRRFDSIGDVSWLAPPYLPDPDIIIVHQVRHPVRVIRSMFEMGLFHSEREHTRPAFVEFARKNFEFSQDPLHSCMRFYIEWNSRCESLTDKRFRIEDLDDFRDQLGEWLGLKFVNTTSVSKSTNRRGAEIGTRFEAERLCEFDEYRSLRALSAKYGYEL